VSASGAALAQGYPNKPIKMIVPYPPGGGTDGLGRITCQFLSEKLGQPIVIQNVGGASGTLGSDTVRRADADGYTLLFNASLFVLGKAVMPTCSSGSSSVRPSSASASSSRSSRSRQKRISAADCGITGSSSAMLTRRPGSGANAWARS